MLFAPMLAQSIDPKNLETYITDDNFWFEQKLDGRRLLIKVDDGNVVAANRKGETITADAILTRAFSHLPGPWYFDGEFIDGQFWLFDMPYALHLVDPNMAYEQRRIALETVYDSGFGAAELVRLLEVARTGAEKRALLDWCRGQGSEGIMVKARQGQYHPGRRTSVMLKAKFTETADCILGEIRREGKQSSSVFVFDDGKLREIGSVKMTERDLDRAKPGDVVEVRYLYCTNDHRLYQPVFLKFRDDKDPHECTTEQLRFVNKSIREILP